MTRRLAYVAAAGLAFLAALLCFFPPLPWETAVTWPVFGAGGVALVVAAIMPTLRPGRLGWLAVGVVTAGGMAAGLLVDRFAVCCNFMVIHRYGYPYPWLARSAEYEQVTSFDRDPPTFDADATWALIDRPTMFAVLIFWACAGLVLVLAVQLVRRALSAGRAPSVPS